MSSSWAPLPEPVPPEEWECCGSECGDACVWQLYYRAQAAYAAQQQALQASTEQAQASVQKESPHHEH